MLPTNGGESLYGTGGEAGPIRLCVGGVYRA